MTLHIGTMMPDRSLAESNLLKTIVKIASDLARLREHPVQKRAPVLDIVFLLPSRQEKADFDGLRLHSFNTADQTLRIECSAPDNMLQSVHAERFVIAILKDAIEAAGEFFIEQGVLFDSTGHMTFVDLFAANEQRAVH